MFKKNNDGFGTIGAIIYLLLLLDYLLFFSIFLEISMREGMI